MIECWVRFKKIVDSTPDLTLGGIAAKAGLANSQFQMWFKNDTIPAGDKLLRICDIVGISVRWFLTGVDEDTEDPILARLLEDEDAYETAAMYLECSAEKRAIIQSMLKSWDIKSPNKLKGKKMA
jgi:transcriptional regulator with XRE-family HTH domain